MRKADQTSLCVLYACRVSAVAAFSCMACWMPCAERNMLAICSSLGSWMFWPSAAGAASASASSATPRRLLLRVRRMVCLRGMRWLGRSDGSKHPCVSFVVAVVLSSVTGSVEDQHLL